MYSLKNDLPVVAYLANCLHFFPGQLAISQRWYKNAVLLGGRSRKSLFMECFGNTMHSEKLVSLICSKEPKKKVKKKIEISYFNFYELEKRTEHVYVKIRKKVFHTLWNKNDSKLVGLISLDHVLYIEV